MANYIFQTFLEKKRFFRTKDGILFQHYKRRLLDLPQYAHLFYGQSLFDILRAVVIIKGLLQKEAIEQYLKSKATLSIQQHGRIKHHDVRDQFLQEVTFASSFIDNEGQPIILPFFNRAMNYIYQKEPDKLYDYPYNRLIDDFSTSMIDGFENYNWRIFQSNFVNLMMLDVSDRTAKAFYQPDAQVVLIINSQGRLDVKISLFDRFIKKPNLNHLLSRLNLAIQPYFDNNRDELINRLGNQGLLSLRYINEIRDKANIPFIKRDLE